MLKRKLYVVRKGAIDLFTVRQFMLSEFLLDQGRLFRQKMISGYFPYVTSII